MSKTNENKLVPKLRFPEFKNDEEWVTDKVDSLFCLQDGYPFSSSDFSNTQKEAKQVVRISDINNQNKNGEKVYVSASRAKELDIEKCKVQKGDLLLSLTGAAGFNFFIWNADDAYINQRTIKLVPKKQENKGLIILLEPLIHPKINAIGTGQNNNLSKDALKEIEFPFPQPKEQQKIAACLSSLDDVIKAESKKLELLKEHKKGLLQNLFPQEGETVPKLRFKEFENSGEWEETTLNEIGEPLMCKRIFKEETTPNPNNGVPFYKIGTFGCLADSYISKEIYEEYKSKYSFPKVGDILISASGTIGRLVIYDGSPAYFQDSNIIWLGHNEEKVRNRFLFYCYTNLKWQTSDGGIISRLYNSDFKRMTICFPENQKEQEKIAACLSSLDDLINTQSQKIEALKLHKKGLLQGLFPTINNEE